MTRKIADLPSNFYPLNVACDSPEHHQPALMVYEPGVWEHTCPACGYTVEFTIPAKPHVGHSLAYYLSKLEEAGLILGDSLIQKMR